MIVTLVIFTACIALAYVYFTKPFGHWKKLGIPGPKPTIIIGNFPSVLTQKRNMVYEADDIFRKYRAKGHRFVGVYNFGTPQLLVLDPDVVTEVMVRSFSYFHDNEFSGLVDNPTDPILSRNPFMLTGQEWKEKRGEITPAFTPTRIRVMKPLIDDVAANMAKFIKREITDKGASWGLDTKELCSKFTTDVVSSCVFAVDAKSFSTTENNDVIRQMGHMLTAFTTTKIVYCTLKSMFPFISKFCQISIVDKYVERFFTKLMEDAVKYREENNVNRLDYLDHLIQLKNKKNISVLDMAAHGVTFFIDGFETSSNVMSFLLYALAANPECQTRLRTEINANLEKDGTISFDTICDLPYLEQVLCETLRLYPPFGVIGKKCTDPIYLTGDNEKHFKIDAGTIVSIAIASIHWDPLNYPDPMTFDPDRFAAEKGGAKAYEDAGKFLGFGLGPRICLGKRFAKAQVKIGVAEIVRNFEMTVNSKTQEPIVYDPKDFALVPIGGLWLDFKAIYREFIFDV